MYHAALILLYSNFEYSITTVYTSSHNFCCQIF